LLFYCFGKFICIFELFQELTTSVRSCSCRAHTAGKKNSGFTGVSGISTRINFVSIDMEVTPHPLLFLPENVIGQAKKTAN
jgi:hypothetical protein